MDSFSKLFIPMHHLQINSQAQTHLVPNAISFIRECISSRRPSRVSNQGCPSLPCSITGDPRSTEFPPGINAP